MTMSSKVTSKLVACLLTSLLAIASIAASSVEVGALTAAGTTEVSVVSAVTVNYHMPYSYGGEWNETHAVNYNEYGLFVDECDSEQFINNGYLHQYDSQGHFINTSSGAKAKLDSYNRVIGEHDYNSNGFVSKTEDTSYSYNNSNLITNIGYGRGRGIKLTYDNNGIISSYTATWIDYMNEEDEEKGVNESVITDSATFTNAYEKGLLSKRKTSWGSEDYFNEVTFTYKKINVPNAFLEQVKAQQNWIVNDLFTALPYGEVGDIGVPIDTQYKAPNTLQMDAIVGKYKGNDSKTYTVKYNLNGGKGTFKNQKKTQGKDLTLRSGKPKKTGYNFQGWATSKNGKVVYKAGAKYKKNANVTLYAKWAAKKYAVKYNLNGGKGTFKNQSKTYGKALALRKGKPTKKGYTFQGWSTKKNGKVVYKTGAKYKANKGVTLYAKWKKNSTKKTSAKEKTNVHEEIEKQKLKEAKKKVKTDLATIKSFEKAISNDQYDTLKNGKISVKVIGSDWYYLFKTKKHSVLVKTTAFKNAVKNDCNKINKLLTKGTKDSNGNGDYYIYVKKQGDTIYLKKLEVTSKKYGDSVILKCKIDSGGIQLRCLEKVDPDMWEPAPLRPRKPQSVLDYEKAIKRSNSNIKVTPLFITSIPESSDAVLSGFEINIKGNEPGKVKIGSLVKIGYKVVDTAIDHKKLPQKLISILLSDLPGFIENGLSTNKEQYVTDRVALSQIFSGKEYNVKNSEFISPTTIQSNGDYFQVEVWQGDKKGAYKIEFKCK